MSAALTEFYKAQQAANKWKKVSTLRKKFGMATLGPLRRPCLKAKGGETRCLVRFATNLMEDYDCGARGQLLALAGKHLLATYAIMEHESRRMSLTARQELLASAVNHVTLYKAAGGYLVYKHHSFIHMAQSAERLGNPKTVSTYEDESENGIIAKIGLVVHGSTFAKSVFERLFLQDRLRFGKRHACSDMSAHLP